MEVNTDDQYQFLSGMYVITRRFGSRDCHVTFPESVSYRAMGRSILSLLYVTGFAKTGLIAGVRNYSYSPFSSAK